jgi:ankyrin repeat protein
MLAGCNTDIKTKRGITSLIFAAEQGHVEMTRALIASGCDVQASCTIIDNDNVESYEVMAIHQASEFGHVKILKMLIYVSIVPKGSWGRGSKQEIALVNLVPRSLQIIQQ